MFSRTSLAMSSRFPPLNLRTGSGSMGLTTFSLMWFRRTSCATIPIETMDRLGGREYEGARDFVEALRALLLEEKAPETVARNIFRGQGNASWNLMPSAFRPGTILGYESQQFRRVSDGKSKR